MYDLRRGVEAVIYRKRSGADGWLRTRLGNIFREAASVTTSAVPPPPVPEPDRMSLITALFSALSLFGIYYVVVLARGVSAARAAGENVKPTALGIGTGVITDFLDTLGVGSFATTTTIFRSTNQVRDEKIPGTLNVGHAMPTIAEAVTSYALFRTAIDAGTLVEMIIAAVVGAWVGARVFGSWPRRKVQFGMGFALLVAVGIMFFRQVWGNPMGGDLVKLE